MKFSIATTLVTLVALTSAIAIDQSAVRQDDLVMLDRRAGAACCVAGKNKKQDACTNAAGAAGKCVPANTAGCKL
jgi:hypothetical protein